MTFPASTGHQKNTGHNLRVAFFFLIIIIATSFLPACGNDANKETEQHITSLTQLIKYGYYTFVLPSYIEERLGWHKEIYMWSKNAHCKGISSSQMWNPVILHYFDNEEIKKLSIVISPFDEIWNHWQLHTEIPLSSKWINGDIVQYEMLEDGAIRFFFEDIFAMNVTIWSTLSLEESINIIAELEYLGPEPDSINNPWESACE